MSKTETVQNKNVQTENPLPSLERCLEIANFIGEPLNGNVLLFNPVAPTISISGVSIDKATQESKQLEINKKGILVIKTPENSVVKAGDKVMLSKNADSYIEFSRVITTNEVLDNLPKDIEEAYKTRSGRYSTIPPDLNLIFKKYVVLCIHPSQLLFTLND